MTVAADWVTAGAAWRASLTPIGAQSAEAESGQRRVYNHAGMTPAAAARAYNRVLAQRELSTQAIPSDHPGIQFVNDQGPSADGPVLTAQQIDGPIPGGPDQLPQPVVVGSEKPKTVVPEGLPDDLNVTQPTNNGGSQTITVVPGTGGQSYDTVTTNPDGSTMTSRVVSDGAGGATIWTTLPDGTHSVTYVSPPNADGHSETETYSYSSSAPQANMTAVTVGDGDGSWDKQTVGPNGATVTSHVEIQSDGTTYNETIPTPGGGTVTVASRPGSPDFQDPWTVGVHNPDGSGWFNSVTGTQATFGADSWGQPYRQEYDPVRGQIVTRVVKGSGTDAEWVELIVSDLNGNNESHYRLHPDGRQELLWRRVDLPTSAAAMFGPQSSVLEGRKYRITQTEGNGYNIQFDDGSKIRLDSSGTIVEQSDGPDNRSFLHKTGDFLGNLGSGLAEWGSSMTSVFRLGADIRAAGNPLNPDAVASASTKYERIAQANGATANFAYSMILEPVVDMSKYLYYHSMSATTGMTGAAAGGPLTSQGRQYENYASDYREQAPSIVKIGVELASTLIPLPPLRAFSWLPKIGRAGNTTTRTAGRPMSTPHPEGISFTDGTDVSSFLRMQGLELPRGDVNGNLWVPLDEPMSSNSLAEVASAFMRSYGDGPVHFSWDMPMPQPGLGTNAQKVFDAARVAELAVQGHAPQRHLIPTDDQLKARLGSPVISGGKNPKVVYQSGYVQSNKKIDPAKGPIELLTRDRYMDKYAFDSNGCPLRHKCGQFSTAFGDERSMVAADAAARAKIPPNSSLSQEVVTLNPSEVRAAIGDKGIANLRGYYINPANPLNGVKVNYKPVDFTGTTVLAVYRRNTNGDWDLNTMYPEPEEAVNR